MTRTNWERIDMLFRFLVTGGKALAFGLVLWYLLLAVSLFSEVVEISRHMHQKPRWLFYYFRSDWVLGLVYGGMFFLGAMLASRSRWSFCPASAAFAAYAVFTLITLPGFEHPIESDLCIFLLPLLTMPIGGWWGERAFNYRSASLTRH